MITVFSTAFELRGADLPFFSCAGNFFFFKWGKFLFEVGAESHRLGYNADSQATIPVICGHLVPIARRLHTPRMNENVEDHLKISTHKKKFRL
jgi:hypothetical protein